MPITISGSGTITGLTTGGLPDGSIAAADIAAGVIPAAFSLSNAEDGTGTDFEFNSGYGSNATAYGVRAWVQFQGSNGTINANGNVSSVTRNSTGNYTVNFATAMPDDDYAATCSSKGSWNLLATHIVTTNDVNVLAVNQSFAYSDHTFISVVIVR